jgi:hypothetical protein
MFLLFALEERKGEMQVWVLQSVMVFTGRTGTACIGLTGLGTVKIAREGEGHGQGPGALRTIE